MTDKVTAAEAAKLLYGNGEGGFEPSSPSPNEVSRPAAAAANRATPRSGGTMDVASGAARGFNNLLWNTADAASAGAVRPVSALMYHLIGGMPMDKAKDTANQRYDQAAEGLPFGLRIASEIVGAGKGLPKYLDKGMEALTGTAKQVALSSGQVARRYALGAAAGVPAAALDRYNRDDMSLEEALGQGLADSILGTSLGVVAGEVVAPSARKLVRKLRGPSMLGGAVQEIAGNAIAGDSDSMSLQDLLNVSDRLFKGKPEDRGKSLLELANVGTSTPGERAFRFQLALSDLVFEDLDPTQVRRGTRLQEVSNETSRALSDSPIKLTPRQQMQLYDDINTTLTRGVSKANTDAQAAIDSVLGPQLTLPRADEGALQESRNFFKELNSDGTQRPPGAPMPLGATPINGQQLVAEAGDAFQKSMDRSFENFTPGEAKVWNTFTDLIRAQRQEEFAKGVSNIAADPRSMKPEELEALFAADMPLANIYSARKAMADLITPSGRIDGTGLDSASRRAVMKIVNFLDSKIDEVAGEKYGDAKGKFSQAMRREELERLGAQFYKQRRQTVEGPDAKRLAPNHYGESLEDFWRSLDEKDRAHFRKGWVSGMTDRMGVRKPLTELHYFFGDVGDNNVLTDTTGKDHMALVMGERQANRLEDVYTVHNVNINETSALQALYNEARLGLSREQATRLRNMKTSVVDMDIANEHSGGDGVAGLAKLANIVKIGDRQRIIGLGKLLTATDRELASLLEQGVKEATPGRSSYNPFRLTSMTQGVEYSNEDNRPDNTQYDPIQDYLDSAQQEPN